MAPTFTFLRALLLITLCVCATPDSTAAADTTTNTAVAPTTTLAPTNTPVAPTTTLAPTNTPVAPTTTLAPTNTPVAPTTTLPLTSATGPPTTTPSNTKTTGPPTTTPGPDKVFPGNLDLDLLSFEPNLSNESSDEFKKTSKIVTDDIKRAFDKEASYDSSKVLKFEELSSSGVRSRAGSTTRASVEILFTSAANFTKKTVFKTLEEFSTDCTTCTLLKNITAVATGLCNKESCDYTSSQCLDDNGIKKCSCLSNFVPSVPDKYCVACPSGQQPVNEKCRDCSFGYSGFNCNENWKLLLVIVGSVLGGLLLIAVITLVTVAVRSKKHRKAGHDVGMGKQYTSHFSPQVNRSAGINHQASANIGKGAQAVSGMPRIPRASANRSWDGGANLEMAPSSSRQNLISNGTNSYYGDHDSVVMHGQNRSQNNPYSQNRPQSNPYSSARGQDNPYYKYDSR